VAAHDLVAEVSASHAVGAQYVTTSPFRACALASRRGLIVTSTREDIRDAVWAGVPWLPNADPAI